ncbi:histone-fold-containing protein [Blastocladiella britannica]|nr:histone-fold-containing protein [Blastocladiella britannica]
MSGPEFPAAPCDTSANAGAAASSADSSPLTGPADHAALMAGTAEHQQQQQQQQQQQTEVLDWEVREQDRLLPVVNVARIMKSSLPENAKIGREAKDLVQECASEFIAFITSEANDRASVEKRKIITGEDILGSLSELGFDSYESIMQIFLTKYQAATTKTGKPDPGAGSTPAAAAGGGSQPTSLTMPAAFDMLAPLDASGTPNPAPLSAAPPYIPDMQHYHHRQLPLQHQQQHPLGYTGQPGLSMHYDYDPTIPPSSAAPGAHGGGGL